MVKITKKQEREVMQEEMSSNIKVILEYTSRIPKIEERLEKLETDMGGVKNDIAAIKVGQKNFVIREEFDKHGRHGLPLTS